MKSIFLKIRANYNEMGFGERRIADLLASDPGSLLPLSITEFAEKAGCDVVDLRLHFYHFNRVFLHPNRQRHEHDLADQREQNDGQAIIAAQPITKIHDHGQNIQ